MVKQELYVGSHFVASVNNDKEQSHRNCTKKITDTHTKFKMHNENIHEKSLLLLCFFSSFFWMQNYKHHETKIAHFFQKLSSSSVSLTIAPRLGIYPDHPCHVSLSLGYTSQPQLVSYIPHVCNIHMNTKLHRIQM